MNRAQFARRAFLAAGGSLIWSPAFGHEGPHPWLIPHVRRVVNSSPVEVVHVEAHVSVRSQIATTTLILTFKNPGHRPQEGQAIVPVPEGASLKAFSMEGSSEKIEAKLLPRSEARRIYDQIVSTLKDPALLEFAGLGAVKTSVFPVPAGKELKLRLTYQELLIQDGERVDYLLPRTQSISYRTPWKVTLDWQDDGGIRTVYSPSHDIDWKRKNGRRISLRMEGVVNPGPLRISILRRKNSEAVASILSHATGNDEGYFLMLLSPPERTEDSPRLKREVTIVIDRSGSMAGEKMQQTISAAAQIIGGLEDGERFNLITYNESVEMFSPKPLVLSPKSRREAFGFLKSLRVSGGTNIHDALLTALGQPGEKGTLPMVLFLTDGLPTIGETSEKKIRMAGIDKNRARRRVFTFGVGVDVNTPLLSRLADDSRATASYVLPGEDVELKVAKVFRRLSGPVLANPRLEIQGDPGRVTDVIPGNLPDFYEQDQIVILGRYRGAAPVQFHLKGSDGSTEQNFQFQFKPGGRKLAPFVPRLWANRRIAILTEALRDLGADSTMGLLNGQGINPNDPRLKELVDEIVRLSRDYGILTEYTAFLARDGELYTSNARQQQIARDNFQRRAISMRCGAASANQEVNIWKKKGQVSVDPFNNYVNEKLEEVTVDNVQQLAGKTFYRNGVSWVDSQAVKGGKESPVTEIEIGSPEFFKLVDRLVSLGEQSCLALGSNTDVVIDSRLYRFR
ncbi:VIT domain-containing protein [Akkermansiaceae bacterium]|nr:VIT domain-containing protein [Akkermansiaceae bacterium]